MAQNLGHSGPLEPRHTSNGNGAMQNYSPLPQPDLAAPAPPASYWLRALRMPLTVAIACGLGAFLACTFLLTKWYSSATTLYFASVGNAGAQGVLNELTGGAPVSSDGSVPFQGGLYNVPMVGSGPATAIMALSSGRCTGRVMNECHLAQRWHLPPDKAANRLIKNVSYGVDKNGLLALQVTDTNPKLAVQIVNSYVGAMRDVTTELSVFYARRVRRALEADLAQRVKTQDALSDKLLALQIRAARAMPVGANSADDYAKLDTLSKQATVELASVQSQIDQSLAAARVASRQSGNLPAAVPFAQAEGQRLRDLQNKLYDAEANDGPDNPDLIALKAQVAQARIQYKREVSNQLAAVQQGIAPEVAALYVTRAGLQASISRYNKLLAPLQAQLKSSLPRLPATAMQIARLENQSKTNQAAIEVMTLEVDRAKETESRKVPTFETVDGAGVPTDPSLPRTTLTTAFAAMAGFLVALAWRVGRAVSRHPSVAGELRRLAELYDLAPMPSAASLPSGHTVQNVFMPGGIPPVLTQNSMQNGNGPGHVPPSSPASPRSSESPGSPGDKEPS